MEAGSQVGCVGNIKSRCLVQSCCDMLLRGADRRRDQEQRLVKMDRRLAGDDADGGDHGRTLEVDIDIFRHVKLPLTQGKEKVERTCSAVIDAFVPLRILVGRTSASLQEVVVHSRKTNQQGRQE